jgi:antitoxin (DNA-binding transcriptional repressor) of toxin-antitoxin stability system
LGLIDQMSRDRQAVSITKRGRPVAILQPIPLDPPESIIGALRGSVIRYDDPLSPAAVAPDWTAS